LTHWWDPRLYLRLKELQVLQKQIAKLQANGLPVPPGLQIKVNELEAKLSR
jgi:hypothetical protein